MEIKLEIYELKVKNQLVGIISKFALMLLILFFAMFLLFFCSLALGAFLNNVFENNYIGFVIISAFYLIICLLLIFYKGKIIKNRLFQAFFSDTLTIENDEQDKDGQD